MMLRETCEENVFKIYLYIVCNVLCGINIGILENLKIIPKQICVSPY